MTRRIPKLQQGDISLVFLNDAKMRFLNRSFRGKDITTDVLSFVSGNKIFYAAKEKLLGEIFINPFQAKRQSNIAQREILLLIIHGILHLLGFDHNTPQKEKKMFALQENFLLEVWKEKKRSKFL